MTGAFCAIIMMLIDDKALSADATAHAIFCRQIEKCLVLRFDDDDEFGAVRNVVSLTFIYIPFIYIPL